MNRPNKLAINFLDYFDYRNRLATKPGMLAAETNDFINGVQSALGVSAAYLGVNARASGTIQVSDSEVSALSMRGTRKMKEDAPLSSEQILLLRDAEEKRLAEFPSAPHGLRNARPTGVLLSDEIEFYIEHFKLVTPSKSANIKAASYELRVGKKYAIGNKVFSLSDGGVLTFPKFEVVVVEILETLNLPDFLFGRWNIRTRWAYEGLIW